MKQKYFTYILILVVFGGCINENLDRELLSTQAQITTSAAVPIGFKQTSLKEVFKKQLQAGKLIEDSSGLLWLKYKQEFDTIKASDILQFPDISQSFTIKNTNALNLDTLNTQFEIVDTFYIDFGYSNGAYGEELDSIRIANLDLTATVSSNFAINGFLHTNFINTLYHNKIYYKKLILNSFNQFNDLKGYSFQLIKNQNGSNLLAIVCTLELDKSNTIVPANSVLASIDFSFSSIEFEAVYGYLGNFTMDLPAASTVFDFYNERISGDFNFEYVSINLLSDNSIGIPFSFYVHDMNVITKDQQSQEIVLQEALSAQNPALIAYPSIDIEGLRVMDSSSIDISTLKLFSENYATEAVAEISGDANPDGNTTYNFALKNSDLKLDLEFAIPFWGYARSLVMQDTMDFVLKDFYKEDFSSIKRLLFILNATNGFPLETLVQIYFCDENIQIIDSLYVQRPLIRAASEISEGERLKPVVIEPIKESIGESRILNIENTQYIIIRTEMSTLAIDNQPPLAWKFFSDYTFYTQIGVAADIESNL